MGAAGAALATMLSQAVACILALLSLLRGTLPFPFSCNPRKAQPAIMGQVLRLGIPLAAQDVLVNLSFVMITAIVNHMGLTQSAAVGTAIVIFFKPSHQNRSHPVIWNCFLFRTSHLLMPASS